MFERFTEAARQVVVLAQEEARGLGHPYIGTEHLLLALLRVKDGGTAEVLGSLGITLERVREQVVRIIGPGEGSASGQIPFTPRAKKVLELSLREAQAHGHEQIRPEHVLLGLLCDTDGVGQRILLDSGAVPEMIRSRLTKVLPGPDPEVAQAAMPRAHSFSSSSGVASASGVSFRVGPAPEAHRLLMAAAARALGEGRTEFGLDDLLITLTQRDETAGLLSDLGVSEQKMREVIEKRGNERRPPAAA